MSDEKDSGLGSLVVAFLAGAAVGAAVALLTTPKTGPELRENLTDLGDRIREKVADAMMEPDDDLT